MPLRRKPSLLRRHFLPNLAILVLTACSLHAQTATILYDFTGGADGSHPKSTLIRDAAGNVYGTTTAGGPSGNGTAFTIDASNNFSVLHGFSAGEGEPSYGLVMDAAGNLYGTTLNGGPSGLGTVFKIDSSNNYTVLYAFDGSGGSNPYGPLIIDSAGNLYGTASAGGASGLGTVFKIDTSNNFSVLHSFAGGNSDGSTPYSGLVMDTSGNLFGTTYLGGGAGAGTVFEISSSNVFSLVYTFLAVNDGAKPMGGLTIDSSGNLYGTSNVAGAGYGTLFKISPVSGFLVLHAFAGGADGATPSSAPVMDAYGNLYGTTNYGGAGAQGTVFRYDAQGFFTVVHSFSNSTGINPGGLVVDAAGYLYGVTTNGGAAQYGTVYKLPSTAVITQPAKHSILSGSTANFTWTPEAGATSYQMWLGSTAGAHDLGVVGTSGLQGSIANLPTDGRGIYATLWGYDSSGNWAVQDTAAYEAASSTKAQITSPLNGSTLPGNLVTFTWSPETGATSYQLWLGSTAGAYDLGAIGTSGLQGTSSTLPTDGRRIYATLWGYDSAGNWAVQDTATYWAALYTKAQITSPAKGSTLSGSSVVFTWTAETGATSYQVWVGNSPGAHDVTYGGSNDLSVALSGLPRDGRPLYVTLWGYSGGAWTVQDTAGYTAAFSSIIMSLVLDRSGSMVSDGGSAALQAAVPAFISQFNNYIDQVALVSFGNNAEVDVPMGHNFIAPISNAVAAMTFNGGTFGTGAGNQLIQSTTVGPPMSLADLQNNSVVIPPGQNAVKVMVYFTDGLMNTVQDSFSCPSQVLLNYGGFDVQGGQYGDIFDPNSKTTIFGTATSTGFPYNSQGSLCKTSTGQNVTTFTSQIDGSHKSFLQSNITVEAQYRATVTASAMRSESPVPTYIYTIGLGNSVTITTQSFLGQLANDPNYPNYNPNQPAGQFFYVQNCPSSACNAALNAVFQAIASKLLP